jgi:hypothetical protein
MDLPSIADEASWGIGFHNAPTPANALFIANYSEFIEIEKKKMKLSSREYLAEMESLPLRLPYSIASLVPSDRVCVQPKTTSPSTGCTLRSLSHHLALLPPRGFVRTLWILATPPKHDEENESLNILLVPFPYRLSERCFRSGERVPDVKWRHRKPGHGQRHPRYGYFDLVQDWLAPSDENGGADPARVSELSNFLLGLVKSAESEVGSVGGVVLPEAALNQAAADEIAVRLAEESEVGWFIAGVADQFAIGDPTKSNWAQYYRLDPNNKEVFQARRQRKHHRWLLDGSQIKRYSLARVLAPDTDWWEHVMLCQRECAFYVVHGSATMTAIVCEDLARHEPVMPVLRAVGPTLLVALLMDGPQLRHRWSARHATVLADDPGCSVLTLTSLGMVRRSAPAIDGERREIAVWKEPGGDIKELKLPIGDHALVLTLSVRHVEQITLDGRSDEGTTRRLELTDVNGVRGDRCVPVPDWFGLN